MKNSFQALQKAVHENAIVHGWWENPRAIPELLCLVHSEVSEALEAYRTSDDLPGRNKDFAEELADIVIRVMDLSEAYGIDLFTEIDKKHNFNKSRPYRHGGKVC